jgi:hypothetical protein
MEGAELLLHINKVSTISSIGMLAKYLFAFEIPRCRYSIFNTQYQNS